MCYLLLNSHFANGIRPFECEILSRMAVRNLLSILSVSRSGHAGRLEAEVDPHPAAHAP